MQTQGTQVLLKMFMFAKSPIFSNIYTKYTFFTFLSAFVSIETAILCYNKKIYLLHFSLLDLIRSLSNNIKLKVIVSPRILSNLANFMQKKRWPRVEEGVKITNFETTQFMDGPLRHYSLEICAGSKSSMFGPNHDWDSISSSFSSL